MHYGTTEEPRQLDMSALARVLPACALEPHPIALVQGFFQHPTGESWRTSITLVEPPAGQHLPHIEPMAALEILLLSQSVPADQSSALARDAIVRAHDRIATEHWSLFLDRYEPDSHYHLPVGHFLDWLRSDPVLWNNLRGGEVSTTTDRLNFIEHVAKVAASTAQFRGPDNYQSGWTLEQPPSWPLRTAMIEFVPEPPWIEKDWGDWESGDNPFLRWRKAIEPVAELLERTLGEPVYHFKNLGEELDDDSIHRFLFLHWCCTWQPQSPYVQYLMKSCNARTIEEFKAALIDPANYAQPFRMHGALSGTEPDIIRMAFVPRPALR